jgi:biopolymer transport protein ExbD
MAPRPSAPQRQRRSVLLTLALALPGLATTSCTKDDTPPPATLAVKSSGALELNGAAVLPESLPQALRALAPATGHLHLIITADPAATHQAVVTAMQAAQSLGARISFSSGVSQ